MSQPQPPYAPLAFKHAWKYLPREIDPASLLHRVAIVHGDSPLHADDLSLFPANMIGTTCCGALAVLYMPGILERMGAPRCPVCCDAVGVPHGDGIPGNGEQMDPADQWVDNTDYLYANGPRSALSAEDQSRIDAGDTLI